MNYFRTSLLLAAMTGLFIAIGYMLGGAGGAVIALLIAGGMNLFAYWNSDKMLLRMHGAHEVDPSSAPELHEMVSHLAGHAGLPTPRVYVMETEQPNAFA
ncbi:MAG: protease HtpX, partial [Alphaproteobacteria bacterium]|nr:protease HtpX [Alphaproteobacteria bacterium]